MKNFYCYHQTNPDFIVNDKLTFTVIIEAESEVQADLVATKLGMEFSSDDNLNTTGWDTATGYASLGTFGSFVRGARHYDEKKVNVGQAFCYLYDAEGLKHSFVRTS